MGLNPSVVSFFFCSGRRRRLPPRPLCGSDPMQPEGPLAKVISIHAPRVGSDWVDPGVDILGTDFNPRSPCGERHPIPQPQILRYPFQSTLPVWGATLETGSSLVCDIFQSTLPVWGATYQQGIERFWSRFQSTLPVWGATRLVWEHWKQFMGISIHAPRVGSDRTGRPNCPSGEHFNPRSPCGERRRQDQHRPGRQIFQSTLPVWGATGDKLSSLDGAIISIHAPRVGSDRRLSCR